MTIKLQRLHGTQKSTIGFMSVDGEACFVLEDAFHVAKIQGQTRIPAGSYEIKLRTEGGVHAKYLKQYGSEFHKGMLWLQNVPGFTWIYIHKGNVVQHTDGCLLVGDVADLYDEDIGKSAKAYERLYLVIAKALEYGEKVFIEIKDEQE